MKIIVTIIEWFNVTQAISIISKTTSTALLRVAILRVSHFLYSVRGKNQNL